LRRPTSAARGTVGLRAPPREELFPCPRYIRSHLGRADRHIIVSRNHNAAPLPPIDRPAELRQGNTALARSFRYRIPQPPAPRGRRDRVYRSTDYPLLGQRELVLFLFQAPATLLFDFGGGHVSKIPRLSRRFKPGHFSDIDSAHQRGRAALKSQLNRCDAATGNRTFKNGCYRRTFDSAGV